MTVQATDAIMLVASVVLAVATAGLMVATFQYAMAARATVVEMQKVRVQAVRPHLVLTPALLGAIGPIVHLTNAGPGHALNIRGELRLTVGVDVRWRYEVHLGIIAPGTVHRFDPRVDDSDQPPGGVNTFVAEDRHYQADLAYEDVEKRPYRLQSDITWRELTEHLFGAHVLIDRDPLEQIARSIREIEDRVRAVANTFDGVKVTLLDRAETETGRSDPGAIL